MPMKLAMNTVAYSIVSTARQTDASAFLFHVNQQAADLRQSVLEVVEVCEQVHNGVTDLTINRLSVAHTHQWTRVI